MKKFPLVLLTAVVVGAPLGYFAYQLQTQNTALKNQLNVGQLLSSATFSWDKHVFTIEHTCKGQVKETHFEGTGPDATLFCIGENHLELKDDSGKTTDLETATIQQDADAPLLDNAYMVPGTQDGTVLLSYGTDVCRTDNNCGVGPQKFREWEVKLSDATGTILKNIPTAYEGYLVWNSTGNKALDVTPTVGGAGYSEAPLQVYDLATDTVKAISQETAAFGNPNRYSSDASSYKNASGEVLSHWGYIDSTAWTDDTHVKVELYAPDGTKTDLTESVE